VQTARKLRTRRLRQSGSSEFEAAVVTLAAMICVVNLSVDLLIGFLDPRISQ